MLAAAAAPPPRRPRRRPRRRPVPVVMPPMFELSAAMFVLSAAIFVLSPAAFVLAAAARRRPRRRPRRPRRVVPMFPLAFCALASCVELLLAFCASTARSAKTRAAVVKVTKRRTTTSLTLLFLLTDDSPPVNICALRVVADALPQSFSSLGLCRAGSKAPSAEGEHLDKL